MLKISNIFIVLGLMFHSVAHSDTQVSIGIGLPNVSIGINLPVYPELIVVPGYPVYYAPRLNGNFFFYDGMYWVYQDDYWYASSWYSGPWSFVYPEDVPVFVLRIPVRYYRQPPAYFYGWRHDEPPRWGDHWGHDWEQHRHGWDKWKRNAAPAPAPLPAYQRKYSRENYPQEVERQHELQQQHYRYQPRDPVVQQRYQEQEAQRPRAQRERQGSPDERGSRKQDERGSRQQDTQRSMPREQDAPDDQRSQSQRGGENIQRPIPVSPQQGRPEAQDRRQLPQSRPEQYEQRMPRSQEQGGKQQGKDNSSGQKWKQEQGEGRGRND